MVINTGGFVVKIGTGTFIRLQSFYPLPES